MGFPGGSLTSQPKDSHEKNGQLANCAIWSLFQWPIMSIMQMYLFDNVFIQCHYSTDYEGSQTLFPRWRYTLGAVAPYPRSVIYSQCIFMAVRGLSISRRLDGLCLIWQLHSDCPTCRRNEGAIYNTITSVAPYPRPSAASLNGSWWTSL